MTSLIWDCTVLESSFSLIGVFVCKCVGIFESPRKSLVTCVISVDFLLHFYL